MGGRPRFLFLFCLSSLFPRRVALIINPSPYILLNHQPSLLLLVGPPLQIRRESWALDLPNKTPISQNKYVIYLKNFYHEGRKECFQPFVESLRPCLSDSSSTKKNFLVSKEEERGGGRVKGERERERGVPSFSSLYSKYMQLLFSRTLLRVPYFEKNINIFVGRPQFLLTRQL